MYIITYIIFFYSIELIHSYMHSYNYIYTGLFHSKYIRMHVHV